MISTHGYFEGKPSLGLPDTGGQVVFVIELSKALAESGYKVDILTRQFEDFSQIETINENVQIVRIPCGGKDFIPKEYLVENLPDLIDRFAQYCKNNNLKYEFIDSHYWDAGFVGIRLGEIFDIPVIFTPHSLGIWKKMEMEETLAKKGIEIDEREFEREYNFKQRNETERVIMNDVDKVIATTPQQMDIICEKYEIPEGKVAIITPGFDANKYQKIDKKQLTRVIGETKLPDKFIMTVGRIASNKGYDLLIEAMKYVLEEIPDIKLVLRIGSQKPTENEVRQKHELSKLAEKLGISDKLLFLDYIEELEYLYNAASVFVLSSTYEPFGMTAIEAMACGTPTVVTDKGGLKYFLEDGKDAMIVNPFDTGKLAKTIVTLLKDRRLYDEISRKGYHKAYSLFTWEMIANKTLEIIRQL
jgi:mannosylfructose-phosphate synthase